ncbi:MAG: serine--tRNA ligase [Proteobacteria bacterium]|nr:serine--tRNA ligase [Pseudomonadota bacterium]NIS68480.1 serine--tRNA ligase [Pseudomonadota bacterium]
MLDVKYIRQNLEPVKANCRNRDIDVDVDRVLELDSQRRDLQFRTDNLRKRTKELSQVIPGEKDKARRDKLVAEAKETKESVAQNERKLREVLEVFHEELSKIPNMSHPDAPVGAGEEENREIRHVGEIPKFSFEPKNHVTLGEKLDLIDFEGGTRVVGQKFYYLKNEAVLLEYALIRYAMDMLVQEGFTLYVTPDLARSEILDGIGFNPRGEETQVYSLANSDLCLIGTAEITLGGLYANQILAEDQLPLRLSGISHCFRTEAGAPGRAAKGLYRVHQFTKVEMFAFTRPHESEEMHESFVALEETIFRGLEIPYRVMDICTGDLGGPAYRKYDLEAWMPGRGDHGGWGEVTSTSNCTDYQARRLKIRYKSRETGRNEFVHMLNGTAVAVSRTLIAIMENFQQADGSIVVPEILRKYTGFDVIKR